jgi:hypothetical protein
MIVIYRITSKISVNPSPIFNDDKAKLNEVCLKSFRQAFREVNPKVIFLADKCTIETDDMIKRVIPFEYEIIHTDLGQNDSALKQWEMALNQDEDILFQECDYIWREKVGKEFVDGLNTLGLVSPYDHLNFYIDRTLHSNQVTIELVGDTHWRSTERNCLTFAIKNQIFKDNYEIFKKYGYLDGDTWYELLAKGHPLYVPIPSMATHMVRGYLAPSVDWEKIWLKL